MWLIRDPSPTEKSPEPTLAPDIQAILTVLGRRTHSYEKGWQHLNLSQTDLRGVSLPGADLAWANLAGANLKKVNLYFADLRGTDLRGADLTEADLGYAIFRVESLEAHITKAQ
jgi:uncharacterized protein YjbI with pentapeptide repeats